MPILAAVRTIRLFRPGKAWIPSIPADRKNVLALVTPAPPTRAGLKTELMTSTAPITARFSAYLLEAYGFKTAVSPISLPALNAAAITSERQRASPRPRLRPCPAWGCKECAASPARATRGAQYVCACCSCNGKDTLGPARPVTRGGVLGGDDSTEADMTLSASAATSF